MLTVANRGIDVSLTGELITITCGMLDGVIFTPILSADLSIRQAYEFIYRLRSFGRGSNPCFITIIGDATTPEDCILITLYPSLNGISLNVRNEYRHVSFEVRDVHFDVLDLHLIGELERVCRRLPQPCFQLTFECECQRDFATELMRRSPLVLELTCPTPNVLIISGKVWSIRQLLHPIAEAMIQRFGKLLKPVNVRIIT